MLKDEIQRLKEELDASIEREDSFERIYKLSTELDNLIAKYYREKDAN